METFIKQITKKAGASVLKRFGKIGVKYTKTSVTDIVTEADLISNEIIINAIKKKFPTHAIISEEAEEHQNGAEYCWFIDPLDGTRNFATKIPLFAVMIGLARNGIMEMATIFNPYTNELFFAKKGKGAFLNGKKIHCSQHKTWKNSSGLMSVNMSEKNIATMRKLLNFSEKENICINALGSSAISTMYQSDGRRDWRISRDGGIWDYAAPALILKEAGCKVTNLKGKPWSIKDKEFLVANKYLHPKLLKIINS